MVEILIITHGNLASEIVKSAEIIVGRQDNVSTLGLFAGDGIEDFRDKVAEKIAKLGKGEGVLVLVDLFGGSPSNAVVLSLNADCVKEAQFQCITGLNLPMLLEAFTLRQSMELDELKDHCMKVGYAGIKDIRQKFDEYTMAC